MYHKLLHATISSRGKETVRRLSHRLSSKPLAAPFLQTRSVVVRPQQEPILRKEFPLTKPALNAFFITNSRGFRTHSNAQAREGWLAWLGKKKKVIALVTICLLALGYFTSRKLDWSRVVKAGDPVLHEPAREVYPGEIGSKRIQKVINDLVKVMRKTLSSFTLSARQIGVLYKLNNIVWDEYYPTGHPPKEVYEAEDKRPFDPLVLVNPKLKPKSSKKGFIFECCESVPGYAAAVERFLEVEVTGLNQYGQPIKVDDSGLRACILQHECDHLEGILYVDKIVKKTFVRTKHKMLPPKGRTRQGVR
ncbi:peptide deformylase 1A, chloroplastic-like protein [Tanacetum coccineum]